MVFGRNKKAAPPAPAGGDAPPPLPSRRGDHGPPARAPSPSVSPHSQRKLPPTPKQPPVPKPRERYNEQAPADQDQDLYQEAEIGDDTYDQEDGETYQDIDPQDEAEPEEEYNEFEGVVEPEEEYVENPTFGNGAEPVEEETYDDFEAEDTAEAPAPPPLVTRSRALPPKPESPAIPPPIQREPIEEEMYDDFEAEDTAEAPAPPPLVTRSRALPPKPESPAIPPPIQRSEPPTPAREKSAQKPALPPMGVGVLSMKEVLQQKNFLRPVKKENKAVEKPEKDYSGNIDVRQAYERHQMKTGGKLNNSKFRQFSTSSEHDERLDSRDFPLPPPPPVTQKKTASSMQLPPLPNNHDADFPPPPEAVTSQVVKKVEPYTPVKPSIPTASSAKVDDDDGDIYDDAQSLVDELQRYPWYHGNIERVAGNKLLQSINANGTFLVRKSAKGGGDQPHTLMVIYDDYIYNLKMRVRSDGKVALGESKKDEMAFHDVPSLIEHHKENDVILVHKSGKQFLTKLKKFPAK